MLWQIKSPVVNEMQTADMEREYARPVSICAIEFAIHTVETAEKCR